MTNAKLPDALRPIGSECSCNVLNLHTFIGRMRFTLYPALHLLDSQNTRGIS